MAYFPELTEFSAAKVFDSSMYTLSPLYMKDVYYLVFSFAMRHMPGVCLVALENTHYAVVAQWSFELESRLNAGQEKEKH